MELLALAAAGFILIHIGVAGTTLRDTIVGAIGERAFQGLFSVASIVLLGLAVYGYNAAPYQDLWGHQEWARHLLWLIMLPAVLLLIIGLTTPNPTSVGQEKLLASDEPAKGIVRITRHPFLWAVILWGLGHLIINGDLGALLLFGAMTLTAALGTRSIDHKRARKDPEHWARFSAVTSNVPFAAIAGGRNTFKLGELGWWRIALALIIYGVFFHFHGPVIGVPAT